jgi:hypothetical protein
LEPLSVPPLQVPLALFLLFLHELGDLFLAPPSFLIATDGNNFYSVRFAELFPESFVKGGGDGLALEKNFHIIDPQKLLAKRLTSLSQHRHVVLTVAFK